MGRIAVARTALAPDGLVFLEGARWRATAEDAPVNEGERVTITEVRGLKLKVKKAQEAQQAQER